MPGTTWSVEFHPACEEWADALDQADAEALLAAVRVLRNGGPTLGRPLVDTIIGSRHKNMKELRPGSTGRTEVRVLFAFNGRARRSCSSAATRATTGQVGTTRTSPLPTTDSTSTKRRSRSSRTRNRPVQPSGREEGTTMSLKNWEKKVLAASGAPERVAEVEEELRLAAGLTALREQAGLSRARARQADRRLPGPSGGHRACKQCPHRCPRPVHRRGGRSPRGHGPQGKSENPTVDPNAAKAADGRCERHQGPQEVSLMVLGTSTYGSSNPITHAGHCPSTARRARSRSSTGTSSDAQVSTSRGPSTLMSSTCTDMIVPSWPSTCTQTGA